MKQAYARSCVRKEANPCKQVQHSKRYTQPHRLENENAAKIEVPKAKQCLTKPKKEKKMNEREEALHTFSNVNFLVTVSSVPCSVPYVLWSRL